MDNDRLYINTGKELQIIIAAAQDLPKTLAPHRSRRLLRAAKLAAGMGGATSLVAGGAMWAANLGFWAGLGAALGLGTIPVLVTLGATGLAFGLPRRREGRPDEYARQRAQMELTFCCFHVMAEADGRISEEERVLLRAVLHQFPLADEDREAIQARPAEEVIAAAGGLDASLRRQVLQGSWMLAETDGVSPEEEQVFADLAGRLGLAGEALELKKRSREQQTVVNDLVTCMFRTCQEVLGTALGQAPANEFLESLAQLAATPPVRRNLRNSLTGGHSAGGVSRLLDEHGEAQKLAAQAYNAVRSVHGAANGAVKAGRTRLLELAEGSRLGARAVRGICADIDTLFEEALRHRGDSPAAGD
jgi:tellurite resistance protein